MQTDERSEMSLALRSHLIALGPKGRARMRRQSEEALQQAWPYRHGLRARTVVRSNVTMLRNLKEV